MTLYNGTPANDPLTGTTGDDQMYGLAGDDTLTGLAGNDVLDGGDGNDRLHGSEGNDSLNGAAGNDTLNGGVGDDFLSGDDGSDSLYGDDGADTLLGGTGPDFLYGGAGNDTLDGGADFDWTYYNDATGPIAVNLGLGTATGSAIGSDTLISMEGVGGSAYADTLIGGASNDVLVGYEGNDLLTGGAGSDYFQFWSGTDTSVDTVTDFTAGIGGDQLYFSTARLSNYTGNNPFARGHARLTQSGADTLLEVDTDGPGGAAAFQTVAILKNVIKGNLVAANLNGWSPNAIEGSAAAEALTGGPGSDEINGLAGNDTLNGLAGNDTLYGGTDNDVLNGGDGNDQLFGNDGNDSLSGGAGADNLNGGTGDDTLDGGADFDNANYSEATGPLTVNLALGTATGAGIGTDALVSIEQVSGSSYADILIGGAAYDVLFGSGGNDTLTGGAGPDYFQFWLNGNDTSVDTVTDFTAGIGGDQLFFGTWRLSNYTANNPFASGHARLTQSGADTLFEVDTDGPSSAGPFQTVAILNNVVKGNLVAANLSGWNPNAMVGTAAADPLTGGPGDDDISGLAGNDTLSGLAGNDTLSGGADNDLLNGGDGSDQLDGNEGNDTLTGGAGSDNFRFWTSLTDTSVDTVTDFSAGFSAGTGWDQLYFSTARLSNYTANNPFASGHARLTQSGADTLFEVDTDGPSGAAAFQTVAILNNVIKGNLVALNLNNWNPNAIAGTAAADPLTGGPGDDDISGLAGNDTLNGLSGNDILSGGADNDVLNGGDGYDQLDGNEGNDTLTGGAGSDYFRFWTSLTDTSVDTVTDFTTGFGGDQLYLSTIRLSNYTGNNPFGTGHARLTQSAADTLFEMDTDGPGGAAAFQTVAILNNVIKGNLVAANLSGWNPNAIIGTAAADPLTGGPADDDISGLAGNDTLNGLAGNDSLSGDADNDLLNGNEGNDLLNGGDGNDLLNGGDGSDLLDGGAGNDTLTGGAGSDSFFFWTSFADTSVDTFTDFTAGSGGDSLYFSTARLSNYTGSNPFPSGHARLTQSGANTLFEVDTDGPGGAAAFQTAAILSNVIKGNLVAANLNNWNPNAIAGTAAADPLTGGPGDDDISGLAGNDTLNGLAGNDTLSGGADNDVLNGGDGNDQLNGNEANDVLNGGDGADVLSGNDGNDTLSGGADPDFFQFWNAFTDTSADTVTDFTAGSGGDQLYVPTWRFSNYGGSNPFGSGHARLTQSGADTLLEVDTDGPGGAAAFQTVATLNNVIKGNLVAANLNGWSPNAIGGTAAADPLTGGPGDDDISGLAGNDTLNGLAGNDTLYGGADNDVLNGGDGNDTLHGNEGDDTLTGGAGSDDFRIRSNFGPSPSVDTSVDTITDFTAGNGGDQISWFFPYLPAYSNGTGYNPFALGVTRLTQSGADTLFELAVASPGNFQTAAILSNVITGNLVAANFSGWNPHPIVGGVTADSLTGSAADEDFYGLDGNDTLSGLAGKDTLNGGAGNDLLYGGAGADTLTGDAGSDTLDGGAITDRLGGSDFNLATYILGGHAGVTVNLGQGAGVGNGTATDGFGDTDTLININQIQGSQYADSITGSSAAMVLEQFEGGFGNDTLDGGAITDTLNLENSNRVTYQNAGLGVSVDLAAGTAIGDGVDTLSNFNQVRGSGYGDTLLGSDSTLTERFEGLAGDDIIDGRGGFDYVAYDRSTSAVTVNLSAASIGVNGSSLASMTALDGYGGTDSLSGIEGIRGSAYDDLLLGGLAANGTSVGDGLSEVFIGNAGNDTIDGGQGYDLASYTTSSAAVIVTLNDSLDGSASDGFGGTDVLRHIEGVRGSAFGDTLTGSDAAAFESFEGREGSDQIDGKGGIDRVDYQYSTAGVVVDLNGGTASDGYGGVDTLANIENVRGSRDFNDSIAGNSGNNKLEGLGGNDTLLGGDGNDTLIGGAGADTLNGGSGSDTIDFGNATGNIIVALWQNSVGADGTGAVDVLWSIENVKGGGFADYLVGDEGANQLEGLAGNDTFYGGGGADTLLGGDGDDFLNGGAGADSLNGGNGSDTIDYGNATVGINAAVWQNTVSNDGTGAIDTLVSIENLKGGGFNDFIVGNEGANQLEGLAGNDTFYGGGGTDTLLGGDGNDFLSGGAGADTLNGGNGADTVDYGNASVGINAALWQNTVANDGTGAIDTLAGIENVKGGGFNDFIVGNESANQLEGLAGNDTFYGGGGADTLLGGDGNDFLSGGAAADTLNGDNGSDTIDYGNATVGISAALWQNTVSNDGTGAIDTLVSIENLKGGAFNDFIVGNESANQLEGLAGNDTFYGGGGADTLLGGDGNDFLSGGAAADTLNGGNGSDTIDYGNASVGINAALWLNTVSNDGTGAIDTLVSIENLKGGGFADFIVGNESANQLEGLAGNDTFYGGGGADTLLGGDGNDFLVGGNGSDNLTGGLGTDIFDFDAIAESAVGVGRDVITDFSSAQLDRIDLSTLDANTGLANDQAFSYIGNAAFSNVAGQLRFDAGILAGDVNGDGLADFEIQLLGVASLASGDFFL